MGELIIGVSGEYLIEYEVQKGDYQTKLYCNDDCVHMADGTRNRLVRVRANFDIGDSLSTEPTDRVRFLRRIG